MTDSVDMNGNRQEINWTIRYVGEEYLIPFMDCYPDRLEISIVGFCDDALVKAYFDKYQDVDMEVLPADKVKAIAAQYPLKCLPPIKKIKVNGQELSRKIEAASYFHVPGSFNHAISPFEDWREDYHSFAGMGRYFSYTRIKVPLSKEILAIFEGAEAAYSMELTVAEAMGFMEIPLTFKLPCDFTGVHEEHFYHPGTGRKHQLFFQELLNHQMEIPDAVGGRCLFVSELAYEVEPALAADESLSFHAAVAAEETAGEEQEMMIFIGSDSSREGMPGINGLPLHICMSQSTYHKPDEVTFILLGMSMRKKDEEVFCWRKEV